MIGATDAGYKAHLINVLLNVKTEEKGLQFGVANFKTMIVGENTEKVLESKLMVDKWKVTHSEVSYTEENDLEEEYVGQVVIDQTKEKKYLGFVISSDNNNLANINEIKKKA